MVLALYTRIRPSARSLWVLGLLVAGTPWKLAHGDWTNLLLAVAGPALGWTLGELARTRALRRQDLERRILAQERQRIARELHDVLAHTVSVIVVQVGAAEDVFDARPDLARKALASIDRGRPVHIVGAADAVADDEHAGRSGNRRAAAGAGPAG